MNPEDWQGTELSWRGEGWKRVPREGSSREQSGKGWDTMGKSANTSTGRAMKHAQKGNRRQRNRMGEEWSSTGAGAQAGDDQSMYQYFRKKF